MGTGGQTGGGKQPAEILQLKADLFLIHAPSVFDFRDRDDMVFAYLSDSDSVNVTSVFEMYPLGWLSMQQSLRDAGFDVEIVNLASLMLQHHELDAGKLIASLDAPVFGLDLHWMAHCHGSLEVAHLIKSIHPQGKVIFGGISATYYAEELARDPAVDAVFKGYDTLAPLAQYMGWITEGSPAIEAIPNLVYQDQTGAIRETGFSHKPLNFYNDATVDWSFYAEAGGDPKTTRLIMTLPNTGCRMDCPWCGGSRYAFNNIMEVNRTLIPKNHERIVRELESLGEAGKQTSIYALQCYSESRERLSQYLAAVWEMGIKAVYFEQFYLPGVDMMTLMGRATRAYILLSPESHDLSISRRAGRGTYSMAEMEAWIPRALDAGIAGVLVWFFIGMPGQTARSVMDTVGYCESLLEKFPGAKVIPLICPMVPFLDPGSRFFEEPGKYGYRLFYRTLQEHRTAMTAPIWHQRLNYETDWLSRREIQDVTYEAIRALVQIKADRLIIPKSVAKSVTAMIDETVTLLAEVERACALEGQIPPGLREVVKGYNRKVLAYSSDQIVPTQRPFGDRWFDDFTVPDSIIAASLLETRRGRTAGNLQ